MITHLFTWLNGCKSKIMVAMMEESTVYLRHSAPACMLTGRGKANLRHCSLSFLDRSLNKGSVPRTVSSFKSTSTLLALPASTCLCT